MPPIQHIPQLPPRTMHHSHRPKTSLTPIQHRHSPYSPPLSCTKSAMNPGDVFIDDIVTSRFNPAKNSKNHDIPDAVDSDEDVSQFTTATIDSTPTKDIYGHPKARSNGLYHAKNTEGGH